MPNISEDQALLSLLLNNIGIGLAHEKAMPAALALIRRAIGVNPQEVKWWRNLASLLGTIGECEDARRLVEKSLEIDPESNFAYSILGMIHTQAGRHAQAIDCYRRAIECDGKALQSRYDLACSLLRSGRFEEGWAAYESRHLIQPPYVPPPVPRWQGEKGGHVYVYSEQGVGDKIQFARFLPWVRSRADKVTFATDSNTLMLFSCYAPVCDVIVGGAEVNGIDYQVPLCSLAGMYGATADNLPCDPGLFAPLETRGAFISDGLKVGIVWAGNAAHANDTFRSMALEPLLELAADPRTDLFSLQCGPRAADIGKARAQRLVNDLSGIIEGGWQQTVTIINELDLIVTVDTAVAHLAGALNKPCFLMLAAHSDWRWLSGRNDTPWYPSIRLFRQTKLLDWTPVIRDVAMAISNVHQARQSQQAIAVKAPLVYEPEVTAAMRRILRPGDTFVDVGANVGKLTVIGAELVGPHGSVVAIEPGANNLPTLSERTAGLPNVTIVEAAAWCSDGPITFYLNADDGGGNSLWDPGDWPGPQNPKSKQLKQPVTLPGLRLDGLAYSPPPRLIKIDTEGAEQRALEGAYGMLHSPVTGMPGHDGVPFIIAELHEFGLDQLGCSQQSLRWLMQRHGYDTFMLFADGSMPQLIPPGTAIKTGFILNVLFSTVEAVGERWQDHDVVIPGIGPMPAPLHGYGMLNPSPQPETLQDKLAAAVRKPNGDASSIELK